MDYLSLRRLALPLRCLDLPQGHGLSRHRGLHDRELPRDQRADQTIQTGRVGSERFKLPPQGQQQGLDGG
jgi:hypothetical protein